jgi:hypothetical protein
VLPSLTHNDRVNFPSLWLLGFQDSIRCCCLLPKIRLLVSQDSRLDFGLTSAFSLKGLGLINLNNNNMSARFKGPGSYAHLRSVQW